MTVKAVSDVVFCNEQMRCRLNEIIHPAVKAFILERIEEERKKWPRSLLWRPRFLEDHYDAICDRIWYIHTDQEVRIQRLMESRGYSRRQAERILLPVRRQRLIFRSHADYVVTNNGLLDETYIQIDEGIKKL